MSCPFVTSGKNPGNTRHWSPAPTQLTSHSPSGPVPMNSMVVIQIWDIWQTTWDAAELFTSLAPSSPINFVNPGPVLIPPLTLNNLKNTNSGNYWNILQQMFSPQDGANAAGFSYLCVPIGGSNFSANVYSFDDVSRDTSFSNFNINNAPSYLFLVINDISVNPILKNCAHPSPLGPDCAVESDPTYLLKAMQGFENIGIPIFAISVQNEPQNSNPTYPTSTLTPATEGQIGAGLRTLLNNNGLSGVKIIGYEHNWNNAATYPVQLMQDDGAAFEGVAFHFYALAQASKAIIPKNVGGPWGQRIQVSVAGSLNWALRVGAYATGRVSSSDWTRYSLVVMNWDDNASAGWNPVPVTATIEFRGMQATYTFPVGEFLDPWIEFGHWVTTLWWRTCHRPNSIALYNTPVTNATKGTFSPRDSGSFSVAGRIPV
ncbi:glycoside hydrolase superfamily [Mycena maculata]|uniref:Glycoside hydrolase superfamily n=1 Tax=Mycena maculata TaxID=230809 RepID=A0AAD7MX38_9AGAR|nr:glycoside hydrolase superfamily [Mycena maculata]